MKKTFNLTHPKIKTPRLFEDLRCDVKKYIKRERKKETPGDIDFWDFDCKFGPTPGEARVIHVAEFGKYIDEAEKKQLESVYVEIIAKPGRRSKKPQGQRPSSYEEV